MSKRATISSVVGLGALLAAGSAFAQEYTIIDLGTLGGTQSQAADINASGEVVGRSYYAVTPQSSWHAFRTAPDSPINPATDSLGTLGGTDSEAYGINTAGQTVGGSYLAGNVILRAFRTAPNSPINPATDDLGTLGGSTSQANDINDLGQTVGGADLPNGTHHAFRTAPNADINPLTDDLGTLGGINSVGYGINASGQVVGWSTLPGTTNYHAFRTAANNPINPATDDLGTLGGSLSLASRINDAGQVVGQALIAGDAVYHAFRTAPGQRINPATDDLGVLPGGDESWANGINNLGHVVGGTDVNAFLYVGGTMVDLTTLIPANSGWTYLFDATSINDSGQIVGLGYHNGQAHAFLMTPTAGGIIWALRSDLLGLRAGAAAPALSQGELRSLLVKLEHLRDRYENGQTRVACNMLRALVNEAANVATREGLTDVQRNVLRAQPSRLGILLGCSP